MTSIASSDRRPAGFWIRLLAYLIDLIPVWTAILILYFIGVEAVLNVEQTATVDDAGEPGVHLSFELSGQGLFVYVVIWWLYEAILTSSRHQATVGKLILDLKVVDEFGERMSFGQATLRHFLKYVSELLLFVGYIMIAFRERKDGLHDIGAGTFVVYNP